MGRVGRAGAMMVAAALLIAGCGGGPGPGRSDDRPATLQGGTAERDDGDQPDTESGEPAVRAVATVGPLADLVRQVLGDRGTVQPLVPPGADSHTYEPRPRDVAEIETADVYFGNGLGLNEGALALAESASGDDAPVIRLAEQALTDEQLASIRGGGPDHGHAHATNPHTWLHVPFAMAKVSTIAEVLAEIDPDGAPTYRANARAYREELSRLHDSIAESAATVPAGQRTIVTFHEAYRYFAKGYGIEVAGVVQPPDASEPDAGDVAALIERIDAEGVAAVFGSRVFTDQVSEQIAAETQAAYYTGLTDDVLPGEPGDAEHSYAGLIAHNARVIIEGLGGDTSMIAEP